MLNNVVCACFCVVLCFMCVVCQLDEGSECVGEEDGIKGTCVSIRRCLSSVNDIKQRKHPQICSFRGREPIICCTDCELFNDTSKAIVDNNGAYYFKKGPKAADKCLDYVTTLSYPCPVSNGLKRYLPHDNKTCYKYDQFVAYAAIGGVGATRGQYPHMGLTARPRRVARRTFYYSAECLEYRLNLNYPCFLTEIGLERQISYEKNNTCYSYGTPGSIEAVGGVDAEKAEFPHMALLGYGDDVKTAQWLCGGSVISDRFILTAAHCVSSSALGQVKFVALGILKRTDPADKWQTYNVRRIITHPQYKPPNKYHDIALLEVLTKIKFGELVLPACLNTGNSNTEFASATGWGALGHRQGLADTLQVVYLYQFTAEECTVAYPQHRHLPNGYDHNTQSCYGDKNKVIDTCEGDSGGPLQVTSQYGGCIYSIVGVTSYGRQCGFAGGGMYTKVAYYVPWIENIVWP